MNFCMCQKMLGVCKKQHAAVFKAIHIARRLGKEFILYLIEIHTMFYFFKYQFKALS